MIRYGLLFLPCVLAALLQDVPSASYLVAWGGSFWIFYLTLSGGVRPLPGGRSLARQLFRPIGITHLVFAGYTAVTSIFYFLSLQGYFYFDYSPFAEASYGQLLLTAEAQRYYVLAHAAFATGILLFANYRRSGEWRLRPDIDRPTFMLYLAGGMLVGTQILKFGPGLGQIQGSLEMLALVASVLSLALSIVKSRSSLIAINTVIYGVNLIGAFLSGWKEEVIVVFLLLGIFLYPFYKRTVTTLAPAGLIALLVLLPTYNSIFRELNWRGETKAQEAAEVALDRTLEGDVNLARQNWTFLTNRFTEIGLFVEYLDNVPEHRPYYGLGPVENGILGIVPRILWPGKPNLERLAMERVYENGVVSRGSSVSAKPQFVVDAYLTFGALGVFVWCLLFGALASFTSRLAERWFGGYLLGSGLVYTALFRVLWRGNAFEFFLNPIFWGFVLMVALFVAGRMAGILVPNRQRVAA
ncbi:exosortase Y-associated Wzy-like protein [Salinibacter altiplanensis]|uniref:exosortase Y-associated Wzy-like protein n=1 Tax=Salinibacter altiplanensis TaxID=1803181 RepID=UPI000C9F8983